MSSADALLRQQVLAELDGLRATQVLVQAMAFMQHSMGHAGFRLDEARFGAAETVEDLTLTVKREVTSPVQVGTGGAKAQFHLGARLVVYEAETELELGLCFWAIDTGGFLMFQGETHRSPIQGVQHARDAQGFLLREALNTLAGASGSGLSLKVGGFCASLIEQLNP